MLIDQRDEVLEEFNVIFLGGVLANGVMGILFIFFISDPKYYLSVNSCMQLRISSYYAGIFCLISSLVILKLLVITGYAAKKSSFNCFRVMIWINGIFPFIYGILQFLMILLVSSAYNLDEPCGALRSLATVYIIVGYCILTFVLISFCSLYTCFLFGQDPGIWPTYLYMRARELDEPIDYDEAISVNNFQNA